MGGVRRRLVDPSSPHGVRHGTVHRRIGHSDVQWCGIVSVSDLSQGEAADGTTTNAKCTYSAPKGVGFALGNCGFRPFCHGHPELRRSNAYPCRRRASRFCRWHASFRSNIVGGGVRYRPDGRQHLERKNSVQTQSGRLRVLPRVGAFWSARRKYRCRCGATGFCDFSFHRFRRCVAVPCSDCAWLAKPRASPSLAILPTSRDEAAAMPTRLRTFTNAFTGFPFWPETRTQSPI